MRINARLDEQTQEKLQYIIDHTGSSTTLAIKQAIHHYFDLVNQSHNPATILESCGFVGCAEGVEELSTDYKRLITDSIGAKHDHR